MKTKLEMAHEWALVFTQQNKDLSVAAKTVSTWAFDYADAMQAEADKRNKAEAEQKRKEIRKILSAPNTFFEREGQHFDDVADIQKPYTSSEEWQPDWSQAPDGFNWWAMDKSGECYWFSGERHPKISIHIFKPSIRGYADDAPCFNYTGDWRESLRKRPN